MLLMLLHSCETEHGLFGIMKVILHILFCALSLFIIRILMITHKINDSYSKLLLVGAVAIYTVQLVGNVGMIVGFFPMTNMPLPFISYGLMPVLLNAFLIGIVLSIYRRKDLIATTTFHSNN
ncbi:hypothetical protein FZC66_05685 [Priestia megaterium]|nr:hypothetical protein FZC66_05685 [Priestia megaterium]